MFQAVIIYIYIYIEGILDECLLISSLPSKALRTLVDIASLVMSTSILKAKPGKLDIKRREPSILFISFTNCFTLQTGGYDVIFRFLC